MKTRNDEITLTSLPGFQTSGRRTASVTSRLVALRISKFVLVLLCSCAAHGGTAAEGRGASGPASPIRLAPGPIAVACPRTPATFSFDKAQGRIEYAADGAGNAARAFLELDLGDPGLEAVVSPVGFVLAPFAAVVGAVRAGDQKLAPVTLAASEKDLVRAMALMADQQQFRDCLLKAARAESRRQFVATDPGVGLQSGTEPPVAILETQVEELRLERTGSTDTSYALLIKTRARLLRATDEAVLADRPFQYRSGTALFVDWTLNEALANVARTGYRKLAEQVMEQLLAETCEAPVLVGHGYKQSPAPDAHSTVRLAAHKPETTPRPSIRFADFSVASSDVIGVFSTDTLRHIAIQTPLTKEDAISEAVRDVEWSLDGLDESHNLLVQLPACVAAVPLSLWKQAVGGVQGLSRKRHETATAQLSAAARPSLAHRELAVQVAQQLATRTAQPVLAMNEPFSPGHVGRSDVFPGAAGVTLARFGGGQKTDPSLTPRGMATAVEVQVLSAALKGKDGVNPPLSLHVEAQVRMLRGSDGAELCALPVHYRSCERKFTEWADADARLFRQELEHCYRELSRAIADECISRQFIPANQSTYPVLAVTTK